jgi:CRP-like cAMP-binding protein
MFQIAVYETYEDGQVIFEEGSHGDCIYVIQTGEVEISKKTGRARLVIGVLKAGDIFGEMAYMDKEPRSATVTAKGEVVVGIVDRECFKKEYNKLSVDFQNVLRTVALRIRRRTDKAVMDEKMW